MFFISRPFGIALGLFIVLNLILAVKEPRLSANRVWLYISMDEPWLSAFASVLGAALLAPHSWGKKARLRLVQAGIFAGFLGLAIANVIGFYHRVYSEQIRSHAWFPFSLLIFVVLLLEFGRVCWWKPVSIRMPKPARRFFGFVLVLIAWFVMILGHIYTFGLTDYTDFKEGADAAVILGAKVYADQSLSTALEDRMITGIKLLTSKKVRYLILSGGKDPNGQSEPEAMKRYALRNGVRDKNHLILDEQGYNTYASAKNCARIARDLGFQQVLVVSQYFHNARVKLIFERSGLPCYTVPANYKREFTRQGFFLFREAIAYPYYLLFYY